MISVVGNISFDGKKLDVYKDINNPLFRVLDIANIIDYSDGNAGRLIDLCEHDEHLTLPIVSSGQRRQGIFVTERGLYNILSQSRKPIARKWRRVVFNQLIDLRKSQNKTIDEWFEEWDAALDGIYYDEEKGMLMQSITVAGGDVEQIPYVG